MYASIDELSDRELEILRLLATGVSNKEIASQLFISPNTVKVHLRNIFSKIEVNSRTEAAIFAVNSGIVSGLVLKEKRSNIDPGVAEKDLDNQSLTTLIRNKSVWGIAGLLLVILLIAVGLTVFLMNRSEMQKNPLNPVEISQGWQTLSDMPTARYNLAAAAYEDHIYAIGGYTPEGITGNVERYHPETDQWEQVSQKPNAVDQIQAVVIGGLIYVPGGRLPSGDVSNILDIYDPRKDTWTSGKSLPVAVSAYALAAYEGRLYLFGGWDGYQYVSTVYSYIPEMDTWQEEPEMPTRRAFAGAGEAGRKIYIVGGYDGEKALATSEVFFPDLVGGSSEPWSQANSLPEAVYAMGVTSVADVIYLVGGKANSGRQYSSLVYFDRTGEWQAFTDLENKAEFGAGLTNLGVKLYLVGGNFEDIPQRRNLSYQVMYTVSFPIIVK